MSLSPENIEKAREYNKKIAGQRWKAEDLQDDELRRLAVDSPEFAARVAAIQVEEELFEDGKLGPRTLQALIERRVEQEVSAEQAARPSLGWWTPGEEWPAAAQITTVSPPLAGESLDAYLDRMGCPNFSAWEVTRLQRWRRNVEPLRDDWARIIPTLRLAEILRHEIGQSPLLVLSGYRPRRYNRAIGGAKNSQHVAFRALFLSLDVEEIEGDALPRKLYEVAARLFSHYGVDLKMGLGFYTPKRGTRISIDSGFALRDWQSDHVRAVLGDLGLTPPSLEGPSAKSRPWTGAGLPQLVFDAAQERKLGQLTGVDAGAGSRHYSFERGVVHYSPADRRILEVKAG